MIDDRIAALEVSDPAGAAHELIERGISHTETADYPAALADFVRAEKLASGVGDMTLVTMCLINQGYVQTLAGDSSKAVSMYEQAAAFARGLEDDERLATALGNLSVELIALGEHEAAIEVLAEFLELVDEGEAEARIRALVNRAVCLSATGAFPLAAGDLLQAQVIARDAENVQLQLLVAVNQGHVYLQEGDAMAAMMAFQAAVSFAEGIEDPEPLRDALMGLAYSARMAWETSEAMRAYERVEAHCREHEFRPTLADALFWHGVLLRSNKQGASALEKWREEEKIRRDLGQQGVLADCLYAQADALRASGEHEEARPLFEEAVGIYGVLDLRESLANALYSSALSAWASGDLGAAREQVDEAINCATDTESEETRRQSLGLKAMVLADIGETDEALAVLDSAQAAAEAAEARSATVWAIARRAYVMAKSDSDPELVVQQLRSAHEHALLFELPDVARRAVRRVASYITKRCDERYRDGLRAFRREQEVELDAIEQGLTPFALGAEPSDEHTNGATVDDRALDDDGTEEEGD